jgi:hypothetical protein
MTHPTTTPALEPVELLLFAGLALAEALTVLIAAAGALLLALIGSRPAAASVEALPAPEPPAPELAGLRVAELLALARAAGLPRAPAHRGRRAELLEALA